MVASTSGPGRHRTTEKLRNFVEKLGDLCRIMPAEEETADRARSSIGGQPKKHPAAAAAAAAAKGLKFDEDAIRSLVKCQTVSVSKNHREMSCYYCCRGAG